MGKSKFGTIIVIAIAVIVVVSCIGGNTDNDDEINESKEITRTELSEKTSIEETSSKISEPSQEKADSEPAKSEKKETIPEKSYIDITASQLISDLEKNAMNAKNTYEDAYVIVHGYVGTIDASGKYIDLDEEPDSYKLTNITCFVKTDEVRSKIAQISNGQDIMVKGKITDVGEMIGYSLSIEDILTSSDYYQNETYNTDETGNIVATDGDISNISGEYSDGYDTLEISQYSDIEDDEIANIFYMDGSSDQIYLTNGRYYTSNYDLNIYSVSVDGGETIAIEFYAKDSDVCEATYYRNKKYVS